MTRKEQDKINRLVESLNIINNKLDKLIIEISNAKETSNIYWSKKNIEIRQIYKEYNNKMKEWVSYNLPILYNSQIQQQIKYIKSKLNFDLRDIKYSETKKSNITKQTLSSLINDTLSTYNSGLQIGKNNLIKLTRLTQQINISEKQLNKNIVEGWIESGSIGGTKKKLKDTLLKKAIDGKYITVIDKNGDPINYDVKYYSEMVARTKVIEMSVQSTINTVQEVGGDLVRVSNIGTTCDICEEYDGKVYSLSGNDPDFPQLTEYPPFHPNCRHSLTPVFREGFEAAGILEKEIEKANE